MVAWSLIAVILGLAFIIVRAFKGHPPFLSCLIAVVFISILSGHSIPDSIATAFATGTANMLRSMLLFFCACTLFGKVMEDAGYAHSITYFISDHVNAFWAPTIIFLTTVVLAMGGHPDDALYHEALAAHAAGELYNIGDSFSPGRILEANRAAYQLACRI